jgi:hypothetical protein
MGFVYDPTNGTKSAGGVYRIGKQKSSGATWDVIWQGSSGSYRFID